MTAEEKKSLGGWIEGPQEGSAESLQEAIWEMQQVTCFQKQIQRLGPRDKDDSTEVANWIDSLQCKAVLARFHKRKATETQAGRLYSQGRLYQNTSFL